MTISAVDLLGQRISAAVASYGDLDRINLKRALVDGDGAAKFTSTQADAFVARYQLVHQQPNVLGNGFSATVFWDLVSKKHVIAIRGTEITGTQLIVDLFAADGLGIGGAGFANSQAAELFRYYKRLTTTGGQPVQYTPQEQWQLFAMKNALLVPLAPFVPVLTPVLAADYLAFREQLASDTGVPVPVGGATSSVLSQSKRVDVTGHSLGGHLAILFARFFPKQTDQVVTLNAPGFFERGDNALTALGFAPPDGDKITRIEADGDGVSEIGTKWPGFTLRLAQENEPGASASVSRNHESANGNDALSLMTLLSELDWRFAKNAAGLSTLLRGASNNTNETYERTLDAVRRVLLGQDTVRTSVSTGPSDPDREILYANIKSLKEAKIFEALSGKASLELASASLGSQARTDFGAFLGLQNLSPVVLRAAAGAEGQVETALANANNISYAAWLADKALTTAQRTIGQATFSDQWLVDRSSMLATLVLRNQQDLTDEVFAGGGRTPMQYRDVAQGVNVQIGLNNPLGDKRQVLFGGDAADPLNGKSLADRLYGGAGMDELKGLDGNDYLEGNAGDDVLDGGRGNDVLVGGAGSDRFVVGFNHGFDSVMGADAGDLIELDGRFVTGSGRWRSRVGSVTVWIDDTNPAHAVRYVHDASRQTLIVSGAGSVVEVFDYQSGDLGIMVPTAPPVAPPSPDTPRFDLAIESDRTQWDAARASDGTGAVRVVNAYGLTFGSVAAGAGDDLIAGGATAPVRQTFLLGGAGRDRIYAGDERPLDDAIAAGEVGTGSRRGVVWLAGGSGDDEVAAGEGADVIFGGEGSDTLVSGAGDDIVFADGSGVGAMTTLGLNNDPVTGEATWVFGINDPRTAEPMRLNLALHLARRGLTESDSVGQRSEVFESLVATLNPLSDIDLSGLLAMSRDAVGLANGDARSFEAGSQRSYRDLTGGGFFGSNLGSGNDVIHTGAGHDVVNAGAGNDVVYAGSGNDMVSGYDGNDQIEGGDGNDRIYGDHAASVGAGVEATETRSVFGSTYTVRNTLDANRHGSDRLAGGSGDDIVIGGGAADDIDGGDGDDMLYGDDIGIDELFAGDDRVVGGAGNDTIYGGADNDELIGGGGDDKLYGEVGDDLISGGDGADLLAGDDGDDELDGGAGRDALFGGNGNDVLVSDGNDLLDGGAGDDAYRLSLRPLRNREGTFEVSSIVQDAGGRSTLAMQDGPGAIGEFSVVNRAGQVLLLAGTAGAVQLGDALDFALTEVVTVTGERATLAELVARDEAGSAGGVSGAVGTGAIRSVDADGRSILLSTSLLTANQTLWGSVRADRLEGGTGGDSMDGGPGNDRLTGGDGADDLTGGAGSDVLVGNVGSDTLRGGDRNGDSAAGDVDTYVFHLGDGIDSIMAKRNVAGPTDVIRFGAGITRADLRVGVSLAPYRTDVQLIDLAYGVSDRVSLDFGAERQIAYVEFADGARVSFAELITASRPASTDGDDRMDGTRFDEGLSGGAGNDTLEGRDGDDMLTGGSGDDVLIGGSGRNTYVFGADSGRDLVRATPGETGLLQFESTLAALRASLIGADLVIADNVGGEVRLLGYGDDARIGTNWQLQAAGTSVALGAWLRSAAPLYGDANAARRQAFLDQQFADLRSVSQYYPGYQVNGYSNAAIPSSVQRTTAQLVSGEAFVHDDYLVRALQTETIRRVVSEPIYRQVRTLRMGAPGGSVTLFGTRADGTIGGYAIHTEADSWGRGLVTPVLGPNGEPIGFATLPTAPFTVTETRIVGWRSVVVEDIQRRTADVARQSTLTGTSGADRISGRGLFRGQIDTGAGDDVIELRSAPIGPYESWDYGRSDWGPLLRERELTIWNAPYQPHGLGAWIDAGSGDDRVLGTDGSDVIVGGTGNDWLAGQAGADTYLIGDDGGTDRIADLAAFDWGAPERRDSNYEVYGGDLANPNRDVVEFDASVSIDRLSYRWEVEVSSDGDVSNVVPRMLKLSHGGREFLDIDYPYGDAPTDRNVSHGGIELFRFADGSTLTTKALLSRLDSLVGTPGAGGGSGSAGPGSGSGGASSGGTGAGASGGAGSEGGSGASAGTGSGGAGGTGPGPGPGPGTGTGTGGSTTTPNVADGVPPAPTHALGDGRRTIGADAGTDTLRFGAGITLERLAIRPSASGVSATFIAVLGDNGHERANHGVELNPASGIRQVSLADGSVLSLDALRITARKLAGTRRDDVLMGDRRDDTIRGDRGTDMIFGRSGHDTLDGGDGNDLLVGEGGDDRLVGGKGVDVLIGGAGNDRIESGAGGGVIAFNRGDGADTAVCGARDRTTLSIGGGIRYDDIRLQRSGGDLVVDFGASDRMTIADWYRSRNARGVQTLQVVTAGSADHDADSPSRLRQRPVVSFDFAALVRRFDAARSRDPSVTDWAVTGSLDAVWRKPVGNGTAVGGEFAYRYATTGQAEPTDAAALRRSLAALSAGGGQPMAPVRVVDPWQAMQASLAASTSGVSAMSTPATVALQAPFRGLSWGALLSGSSTAATVSQRKSEELA